VTVPYPDDEYVLKIGRLCYAVSYLEWGFLGDLPDLAERLPSGFEVDKLAGKTTGTLAGLAAAASKESSDPEITRWLSVAAEQLKAVAELRNHALHARPATIKEKQRLYRWRVGDAFAVTDEWLDEAIVEVERANRLLGEVRILRPQ
jgi:hypothetical protein